MPTDAFATPPDRAAELRAAGLKVGIAALVGIALLGIYFRHVKVNGQVRELIQGPQSAGGARAGGAQAALLRDTPGGWLVAEAGLQKALDLESSHPWAMAAYADVEQMLVSDGFEDRRARADQALAQAEQKDVELPERFEAHALSLLAAGHAPEAESYLTATLSRYSPAPARLLNALGRAQRGSGKLAEAKVSLRRAQDADWRSPRAVADYATLLLEEGSSAEALAGFERALQANGDHLRSLLGKARALSALAAAGKPVDLGAALKLADDVAGRPAAELSPRLKALALGTRAEVRLAKREVPGALEDAQASLAALKTAGGLRARALALAASDARKSEAAQAFDDAAAADPYDASIYFDGSAALSAAGQPALAEKLLARYAALLPRTARYHLALARLLLAKDDAPGAAQQLKTAASLEPTNAVVYYEQGRLLQKQGDAKAARDAYEKAAQLRDDYPEVYRQMGALYLDGRDVDTALAMYGEALRRFKAARLPEPQLESFYQDVAARLTRAREKKKAAQWLKEARAMR